MIKNLNEHEKCIKNSNHIVKIVNKTPKCFFFFSKSKGDLGHTDLIQHTNPNPNSNPNPDQL